MRGPWTVGQRALQGLLMAFLVLFMACVGAFELWPLPDALAGGHRIANSVPLLGKALGVVDKAAGGPIGKVDTPPPGYTDPDSCAFLRSSSGVFLDRLACGGAVNPDPGSLGRV